ncbi:Ccc1 family, partial [Lenzites betulinus]
VSAGLSSLSESKLVILGGIAELIAGAISMGIGGFLATQAERDHYRYLRKVTSARVVRSCNSEMEREVHAMLGPVGVNEKVSQQVASCLRDVEFSTGPADEGTSSSSSSRAGGELRWAKEVGLTAFLLQDVSTVRMYASASTIGLGYLVGGLIPLMPYFCEPITHTVLIDSCVLTGLVLLIFGAMKAWVTGAGAGAGAYNRGAFNTILVGGSS